MEQRVERLQKITAFITAATALILGVIFYNGAGEQGWLVLLSLAAVFLYLQTIVVCIGERADYSLATASVLPIVFLCGPTPAMIVSALAGIADGVVHKKEWPRIMFNAAQLPISALMSALAFGFFRDHLGSTGLSLMVSMAAGALVYILANISLVAPMVSIWRSASWLSTLRMLLSRSLLSTVSSVLIGLVFTLFVKAYGFWGVVGFGVLLINLSGMLKAAVEVSSERARRRELEEVLVIDEMTGALNFRFLNKWLNEPSDDAVTVLFFDIDDFSVFNNEYGRVEGDRVLKMLVETILGSIRPRDSDRYGGDEFVVLLEGVGAEAAPAWPSASWPI